MATTATPRRPRTVSRVRESAPDAIEGGRDGQYDLLTAALIGLAVGVSATMLIRSAPSARRPAMAMLRAAGRGAKWAGAGAGALARRQRGPTDRMRRQVEQYLGQARDTIEDTVQSELRDLRKALRRQRRRLGI